MSAATGDGSRDRSVRILYGSEMGNCEFVADDLEESLSERGIEAEVLRLDDQPVEQLGGVGIALIVVSTYGEGEMPFGAEEFWDRLASDDAPGMTGLRYAVLALGDSSYTYFCEAGVLIDARLAELGATRLAERVDCDANYRADAARWIAGRVDQLSAPATATAASAGSAAPTASAVPAISAVEEARQSISAPWTRDRPFLAELRAEGPLSASGGGGGLRRYELDLTGSGIDYLPGDSLAVVPANDPAAVERFLEAAGVPGWRPYRGLSFRHLATQRWELRFPSAALLEEVARRAPGGVLGAALAERGRAAGEEWIGSRSVPETLWELPEPLPAEQVAALMSPIRYRAYSIASSPLEHPDAVHLAVSIQRNGQGAALSSGVATGLLADRVVPGERLPVFLLPNRAFRLPSDPAVPIIMVGPGAGVAPFRAFLADRERTPKSGRAWLFTGVRHEADGLPYREDWERMLATGALARLDTAFSRDRSPRVHVQDRMREHGPELVRWLMEGARLYVCGDARRMAGDVDAALRDIVAAELGEAPGRELVDGLRRSGRYLRDVY